MCNWVCTSLSFPILCSGAATNWRPCGLIVPWSLAYLVATVRVERNLWTCRFCEACGSVCESSGRLGTVRFCNPAQSLERLCGQKPCHTAPKPNRPHLRRGRLHLATTAPASCKNLAASTPSRGEISIPSLWAAETPLDAGGGVLAAARGVGTLRDAAAAVQTREAQRRTPQARRSPPAPAGTA